MAFKITKNTQFNSYEIQFSEKPAAATLETLKENRFRWNPYKKIWYGYKDISGLLEGSQPAASQQPAKKPAGKISPELLKMYEAALKEVWTDSHMINFCLKNVSNIVMLESGKLFTIDKVNLKTHFCYGYGLNGVTDSESEKHANAARYEAATNGNVFKNENLEAYKNIIEAYKVCLENRITGKNVMYNGLYSYKHYSGSCEKIVSLTTDEAITKEYYYYGKHYHEYEQLSIQDIKNVIAAYKEEYNKLEKRCDTYLKKYGTSKLHTWTYLVD